MNYSNSNDFIIFENKAYKLVSSKYEPFDNDENVKKKYNFMKQIVQSENFQKIINHVNDSLENLYNLNKENEYYKINPVLFDFCLKRIKLLNIINNYFIVFKYFF